MKKLLFLTLFFSAFSANIFAQDKPAIQLANLYHEGVDVSKYFVSEKLDGVRAYFDGEKLISREGNVFKAPQWFICDFPQQHLEGELWIARGKFEELSGIVRREKGDEGWENVRFMLFDMPQNPEIFSQRLEMMENLVKKSASKYLKIIPQERFNSHEKLINHLHEIVKNGGEGLMLHRSDSLYRATRSDDLLKLKTFEDEEAIVISHIAGKGKYEKMMGALLVENRQKVRFKIGGGFSDEMRKSPPEIGSIVTYKFFGKTKNNVPRFPSFVRVRSEWKSLQGN